MQSLKLIYEKPESRADEIFQSRWQENAGHTDRMFAVLLMLQWLAAIVVSMILSPKTWTGSESQTHPHVWLSIWLGGALASLPVILALRLPGRAVTRHVIALSQIMFSSLLIHVTGGRIETHFHVFGSLAFLAFYRDWMVLIPATVLVALDHFVRGVYWPQTVFGITTADPWRWVEHAGWVVFEDVFLIMACSNGVREMYSSAERTAELEKTNREFQEQTLELEAANRSNSAIIETTLDAVVTMDIDGCIAGWNSNAESIFGWAAAEVHGKSLAETIIPHRYREQHVRGLQKYLATGEQKVMNQRIEVTALHRSGNEFPVELSISPIRFESSVSFCSFIRDITARHHAAESLRAAKEAAEAASQAKRAFLANMSHEIRTPLNGILGFADLLRNQIDGDREDRLDHLQTIYDSGRHLLTVINDVLDLSKIESGQMEVELVRCSPHQIIAETISILRVRAQERSLALEYFWKGETPETIQSDPARLRQILMNLIGNAIKFTEIGGVQVTARLRSTSDFPHLIIDVIDSGVGIESSAVERIFDPFVQADTSITRRFGGTGLGLSISRRLARLIGGDLTVNSEPGRGSIFTLTVPTGPLEGVKMNRGASTDIVAPRTTECVSRLQKLPSCKILVVDDGATNRKLIQLVLKQAGANVQCAENGQFGIEAAQAEEFDLILMDMQMPVMDGYSASRKLRSLGFTLPIIALTAHAMSGDESRCRDAGCSGYLTKPIDSSRLLSAVAEALSEQATTQQCDDTASEIQERRADRSTASRPLVSTLPTDDPEFREIVDEFVLRFEEQMTAIRAAWAGNEADRIADMAHWIKGAGGTAGFDALTQPAARLERSAHAALADEMLQQIEELEGLLRRMQMSVVG